MQYVADTIVKAIRTYNEIHCSNEVYEESQPFVLGLTTGRTPLGLYRELVKRHEEGIVSFRNVAVFSLDEFYPIRSTEQRAAFPHPRGFPQPYRHPARKYPHP